MLQAEAVQYDFSFDQPTLGEFLFQLSLWWLIGLILIAGGAYYKNRRKTGRVELLGLVALMLGFGICILLGWYFTPFNRHHVIVWTEDQNINNIIERCLGLMILGTSLLFFVVGRKIGRRSLKRTDPNAN